MKIRNPGAAFGALSLAIFLAGVIGGCDQQNPATSKTMTAETAPAGDAAAVPVQAAPETPNVTVAGQGFDMAILRNGSKAFSKRNYLWEEIPATFDGWTYTRTAGGANARIRVKADRAGTLYVASQAGLPDNVLQGWDVVTGVSFTYSDRGHTRMTVYRRKLAQGEEIQIAQGNWSGTIVLRPPEDKPDALTVADALASVPAVASVVEVPGAPVASERIVRLTAQNPRESVNGQINGSLLVREIQRQAISLAAREELGVRTRDMTLGDASAENEPGKTTTLLIGTQFRRASGTDVIIALPDGTPGTEWKEFPQLDIAQYAGKSPEQLVLKIHKNLAPKPWIDYAQIVQHAEAESRAKFADALKKANVLGGSRAAPSGWEGSMTIAPEATKAQERMDPIAQLAVVRLVHEQIRASGQSPQLLEALVRGYANLGLLLRPLEGGAYKAYMARSLLYAERLVVHEGSTARSLYVRAYARGIAGLGRLALEDLDAAQKHTNDTPPWHVEVMDAWCHYDLAAMQSLANKSGPGQELARMLAVAIAADGYSGDKVIELGEACLQRQPGNLWVMQTLFNTGRLGMTARMPELMREALPKLLEEDGQLLRLPPALESQRLKASAVGADCEARVAAFRLALEAWSKTGEDKGEPSLAAVATVLRDAQFMAAYAGVKHLRIGFGASSPAVAAFAGETSSAWQDHPMAGLLEAVADDSGRQEAFRAHLDKIRPTDAGAFLMDEYKARLPWRDYSEKWPDVLVAEGHQDVLPMDLTLSSVATVRLDRDGFMQALRDESPYAAFPVRAWMADVNEAKRKADPAMAQRTIADVKERFGNRPALLEQCAGWAADIFDYKQAVTLLETLNQGDPSFETAMALLTQYDRSGDMAKARILVDSTAALKGSGLEYAMLCSTFAEDLKRRFRYAEARPYDVIAAGSYAQWALTGLASCEQGLGNSDQVSQILQAIIARYDSDPLRWYAWAKRTGHPDVAAATRALDDYLATHPEDSHTGAMRAVVDNKPEEAIAILKKNRVQLSDIVSYVNYIVVAKEGGDDGEMNALLKRAVLEADSQFKDAALAIQAAANKNNIAEALRDFELKMGPAVNSHYSTATYLGRFLAASGHKKEAMRFLKMALVQNGASSVDYAVVCGVIQRLGEDPAKIVEQMRSVPADTGPLPGTWTVREGGTATEWTFDADTTVTSSEGSHGRWWESDGRILVSWTPGSWAEIPWPATTKTIAASGPKGKIELSRK